AVLIVGVFTAIAVAGSPRHHLHNGGAFPGEQKPVLIFEALQPARRYVVFHTRRRRHVLEISMISLLVSNRDMTGACRLSLRAAKMQECLGKLDKAGTRQVTSHGVSHH